MAIKVIESNSPQETFAVGVQIGREAKPGQVYTSFPKKEELVK